MANGRPDVEIKIASTSDNKGTQEATKEVGKLTNEVKKLSEVYKEGGGGLNGLVAVGKQIGETYSKAGGGVKGAFAVITSGAGKAAAAVTGVVVALKAAKDALVAYARTETQVARLDQAMANQGQFVDRLRVKYQGLAKTLEADTSISSDSWLETIRQLIQAGSTEETLERDINAVKALVGIYGTAESAAQAWGKALQGQFDILREHGIIVDENLSKTEKLNQVYLEIVRRGGGQLETQAQTLTGLWRGMRLGVTAVTRAIGGLIASTGVLQPILFGFGKTLHWVASLLGTTIPAFSRLQNQIGQTTKSTIDAERYNKQYAESLEDIHRAASMASVALERQLQAEKALIQAADEKADAEMAYKLALVDRAEKLPLKQGGITKEEAAKQRLIIRTEADARKFRKAQDIRQAELLGLQRSYEQKMEEIETFEEAARAAEAEVEAGDKINMEKRGKLAALARERMHWVENLEALHADPTSYSNPELGVKAQPRHGQDIGSIQAMILSRIRMAELMSDMTKAEFAKREVGVEGARERARIAREEATKRRQQNAPLLSEIESRMDATQLEQLRAAEAYRIRSRGTILEAGTQWREQFPKAKVFGGNIHENKWNNRGIEAVVMQATQAFQGHMNEMGAAQSKAYETMGAAVIDITRRIRLLEKQFSNSRKK